MSISAEGLAMATRLGAILASEMGIALIVANISILWAIWNRINTASRIFFVFLIDIVTSFASKSTMTGHNISEGWMGAECRKFRTVHIFVKTFAFDQGFGQRNWEFGWVSGGDSRHSQILITTRQIYQQRTLSSMSWFCLIFFITLDRDISSCAVTSSRSLTLLAWAILFNASFESGILLGLNYLYNQSRKYHLVEFLVWTTIVWIVSSLFWTTLTLALKENSVLLSGVAVIIFSFGNTHFFAE